jgi:hypothetical protein
METAIFTFPGGRLACDCKTVLHLSDELLALNRDGKSFTRTQRLDSHHFALGHEANRTMRPGPLHLYYQTHGRVRRYRSAGFQEEASYTYVLAEGFEFANRSAGGKAQTHRELKVKSSVSALLRWIECVPGNSGGIFGWTHIRMLALPGTGEQVAQGHPKRSPGGQGCHRQGTYDKSPPVHDTLQRRR